MRNAHDIIAEAISATKTDHQMPLSPNIDGKRRTDRSSNTSVRTKDITAEMVPLFSAVKNEDVNMLPPDSKNENKKIRNAWMVSSRSSGLYPTKIPEIIGDRTCAAANMNMPPMYSMRKLILSKLLSSR